MEFRGDDHGSISPSGSSPGKKHLCLVLEFSGVHVIVFYWLSICLVTFPEPNVFWPENRKH